MENILDAKTQLLVALGAAGSAGGRLVATRRVLRSALVNGDQAILGAAMMRLRTGLARALAALPHFGSQVLSASALVAYVAVGAAAILSRSVTEAAREALT